MVITHHHSIIVFLSNHLAVPLRLPFSHYFDFWLYDNTLLKPKDDSY